MYLRDTVCVKRKVSKKYIFSKKYRTDTKGVKVEGMTIKEMSEQLGINTSAVKKRIFTAGIKPLTREAIYSNETLEAIRNVLPKGRPKKGAD
jgi:hypothetical protein